MAITHIHKCDKCDHEQDNNNQMWYIGIRLAPYNVGPNSNYTSSYENLKESEYWCRKCVEKLGLLPIPSHNNKEKEIQPKLTLSEIIEELINEKIAENLDGRGI